MQYELLRVTDVLTTCAVVTVRVQVKVSSVLSMAPLDLLTGHVTFVSQLKPSAVSRFIVGPLMGVLCGQFSLSSNNLSLSLSNSKWYSAM